jgi:hypothetical protein
MLSIKQLKKESTTNKEMGFFDWITKDFGISQKDAINIIENPRRTKTFEILTKIYNNNNKRKKQPSLRYQKTLTF